MMMNVSKKGKDCWIICTIKRLNICGYRKYLTFFYKIFHSIIYSLDIYYSHNPYRSLSSDERGSTGKNQYNDFFGMTEEQRNSDRSQMIWSE